MTLLTLLYDNFLVILFTDFSVSPFWRVSLKLNFTRFLGSILALRNFCPFALGLNIFLPATIFGNPSKLLTLSQKRHFLRPVTDCESVYGNSIEIINQYFSKRTIFNYQQFSRILADKKETLLIRITSPMDRPATWTWGTRKDTRSAT